MSTPDFGVIVIGAGISGLAFARFYLDIHPEAQLAIIEENSCIGGVWSSTRLYDEFWTQSGRRMVGFSDVPLTLPSDAPSYYGCVEAKYVNKYLEDYIDSHIYRGNSLRSRIYLRQRVEKVEKTSGLWTVSTRDSRNDRQRQLRSFKVVIATGLTSRPNMPTFLLQHQKEFESPICHHKCFGEISKSLLDTPDCKNVAVLGAGKSATDMVYQSVKKGKDVSWIIRKDGEGPALFFTAPGGGRYENSTEKAWEETISAESRKQAIKAVVTQRPIKIGKRLCQASKSSRPPPRKLWARFSNLGFIVDALRSFWCTGPLGLAQHDDFWDTLAQNVHVYRNDISSIKPHGIVLDDGSEIPADILLCGTGWKFDYPFFSKEQAHSLGLPHSPEEDSPEDAKFWKSLLESADRRVLADFPILKSPPPHKKSEVLTTTMRLYNCMAPLEDPSVVFLGRAHLSNSFRTAEAQAIWATAYFDGNVKMPPLEQAQREVAYMNAFSKTRYPSHGATGDYLFFELVWYTDKLLREVGLKSHRKGWWADWVEPCLAADSRGAKEEYREKWGF